MSDNLPVLKVGKPRRSEATGSITGPIWFELEDDCFPEKEWDDFVVIIFSWWLETLSSMASGTIRQAELSFMDGPFIVRLHKSDSVDMIIEFVNVGSGKDIIEFQTSSQLYPFLQNITDMARSTLIECINSGWLSDDISTLEKCLSGMQAGQSDVPNED